MKIIESIKNKELRTKFYFNVRQTLGQALLSAGAIGYLVDHLDMLQGNLAIGASAAVIGLVLYFTNANKG